MTDSPSHDDSATPGPYATAAHAYLAAGFAPLPLPYGRKKDPPPGWTGNDGGWPSYPDVQAWVDSDGGGNIGLRLPPHVIGIDVDNYESKIGGPVFAALQDRHGALPATWRSTSREDGVSAIRFYRIPAGLRWPGIAGPGIEIIRYGHRYAVAWPSRHPDTGNTYRWTTPAGATTLSDVPIVDELPELPSAWVTALTGDQAATDQAHADLTDTAARQWLAQRSTGPPCRRIDRALAAGLTDLAAGTSRHDTALQVTNRLIWLAGEGHPGTSVALATVQAAFLTAVTAGAGARDLRDAEAEWGRMVSGAVRLAAAAWPELSPDPCLDPFAGLITSPTPTSTTTATPESSAATGSPSTTEDVPRSADDLTELQIRRHQAAAQELEHLRARRTAQHLLDGEDETVAIADRLRTLHIGEQALREWKRGAAGAQAPPAPILLTDLLASPDDPVRYRIEGVWPAGGRVVLAASAKTGKSTTVGNLIRSLADGDDFLDTFQVVPPTGRIILIDNELDPRQIKNWLRAQGIRNTDAVVVFPLRGRLSTFDILDGATRKEWAQRIADLHGSVILFDCLRPLIDVLGLSEDKDAGRVLVAFDALLADSGASEGLVVHHMGHTGERSRGDTRIRDWPDAEWKLVRERTDDAEAADDAPRYFTAFGRDVAVPEARLDFEPAGRRLSLAGGNRADAKIQPVLDDILGVLAGAPSGMSERQIEAALADSDHGRNEIRKARKLGIAKGLIGTMTGPRKALIHYLNDPVPVDKPVDNPECATTAPPPGGALNECATADPLKGGSAQWSAKPFEPLSAEKPGGALAHSKRPPICDRCGTRLPDLATLAGLTRCGTCDSKPRPRTVLTAVAGEQVLVNLDTGEILTRPRDDRAGA